MNSEVSLEVTAKTKISFFAGNETETVQLSVDLPSDTSTRSNATLKNVNHGNRSETENNLVAFSTPYFRPARKA
jgi:hypothetical protein